MRVDADIKNTISFKLLLDDPSDRDLSPAEQEWLLSVALLCPFDFGEAVFVARNIAGIQLGDTTYYEDDSLCVMPEARFGNTETSSPASYVIPINPHIKVYPNPFSSNLIVECSGCENDLLKYEIYSTMGILTHQGSVVEKRINADRLSPGLYFIKVFNDKQSLYSGKIVKQ